MRSFILGVIATLLIFTAAGYVAVSQGLVPANADGRPPKIEIWAAKTSLHATLRRDAPKGAAPIQATDANLAAGIKLYGRNCAARQPVSGRLLVILQPGSTRRPRNLPTTALRMIRSA